MSYLTIPGSNNQKFITSQTIVAESILSNNVLIQDNRITGIDYPIELTDSISKDYVDTLNNIQGSISDVSENSNVTYTTDQVLSGFINRNMLNNSRTDIFPNVSDVVSALKVPVNVLNLVIRNMSTITENNLLTISFIDSGYTLMSSSGQNISLEPTSTVNLTMVILSSTNILVYENNNQLQNLSQQMYYNQNYITVNNIVRTTNNVCINLSPTTISNPTTLTGSQVINSILTILSVSGNIYLPSATDILNELFINYNDITNSFTFNAYIRNNTITTVNIFPNYNVYLNESYYVLTADKMIKLLFKYDNGKFFVYLVGSDLNW